MKGARFIITMTILLGAAAAGSQEFFNLTREDVAVWTDDAGMLHLPLFTCSYPLGAGYADSIYNVEIEYPEFIDMSDADADAYRLITGDSLPRTPRISRSVAVDRKKASLELSFVPFVRREGHAQKLVSFKLRVTSTARAAVRKARAKEASERYASHSVLSSGAWVKIRVASTGVYQLTDQLLRQAGFSDFSKVKLYGYGGGLQPEMLDGDYLTEYDDLKEAATCVIGGRRLFHATGTVTWSSKSAAVRTRNPYSDYGYYFLTDSGEDDPLTIDSAQFLNSFYPSNDDYHTLYEVDGYSWYPGGRNLFDSESVETGASKTYTLTTSGLDAKALLSIGVTAATAQTATFTFDSALVATVSITGASDYTKGSESTKSVTVNTGYSASHTVTMTNSRGTEDIRLDYLSLTFATPMPAPDLAGGSFPAPTYVEKISNQDRHADSAVDMVIIIPKSRKLLAEAERLAKLHEERDAMRVRIVSADELYNEYSSGTPDAGAYRRYMKMLYDRAESDDDIPSYLVLFGDCAWDNRMLTSDWKNYDPDDFLLCFESENSFSEIYCYVSDDFFTMLDDGEGTALNTSDKPDIAVGRIPARTAAQAKVVVDKTESYMSNENAGSWQNIICVMGDDGNSNLHMIAADSVGQVIHRYYPGLQVKKVMWDAYTRVSTTTGNSYPQVRQLLLEQMKKGALMMNYNGHGRADQISHEKVLLLNDFKSSVSKHLPLWITASCDIMAFDGQVENIGEEAMFSSGGGAVAFYGTTRTVYSNYNLSMNVYYTRYVLSSDADGKRVSVGEAARLAKNSMINDRKDLTTNKLQFSLLGDPALVLAMATREAVVDEINGEDVTASAASPTIKAGETVSVSGHISLGGERETTFNGILTAAVRDVEELITCRLNDVSDAGSSWAFTYRDRPNIIFSGTDSVKNGVFSFSFPVPRDISYNDGSGMINLYALSGDMTEEASGCCENFYIGGSAITGSDSIGPSIYCYLNTTEFADGDDVNSTPYFVAELNDEDGINVTGSGIGHDLQLIIDGEMSTTYTLNDYFTYDFGSYTSGTAAYSIPELSDGEHTLLFRAWDVYNNSSTAQLTFNVVSGLQPTCISVSATRNPASESTTFIITHDRAGSEITVTLDIFDSSGRTLYELSETAVSDSGTYELTWDLTDGGGGRLPKGIYLYRVRLCSEGSAYSSLTKKIIIL